MKNCIILLFGYLLISVGCKAPSGQVENTSSSVQITSAMKNVMWKGELHGKLQIDTVVTTPGIYGVGPLEGLRGEVTVLDSEVFVSRVQEDGSPGVEVDDKAKVPFFVRAKVTEWDTLQLAHDIKTIAQLDTYLNNTTQGIERPFALRLSGTVFHAIYHIQNLASGSKVSSPEQAHAGQVKYRIDSTDVDIVGFFSTEHKGIFTHHDSNLHLHLVSKDRQHMGHLDQVEFGVMELLLPR